MRKSKMKFSRGFMLLVLFCSASIMLKGQFNQRKLCDIPASNMLFSPLDELIYGQVGTSGNNFLVRIDPRFCNIIDSISLPDYGLIHGISDDRSKLYIRSSAGSFLFDIESSTFGDTIPMGTFEGDAFSAQDFDLIPETEESIVVVKDVSGGPWWDTHIAVIDGTVERPNVIYQNDTPDLIVVADSTTAFGVNAESSISQFYRFTINEEGLSQDYILSNLAPVFADEMVYYDSLIYFDVGVVVDPYSNPPSVLGQFEFPEVDTWGNSTHFAIDEYNNVMWWAWHDEYDSLRLGVYDHKTLELLGEYNPKIRNVYGDLGTSGLISWGEGNLAFTYSSYQSGSLDPNIGPRWCLLSNCLDPIEDPPFAIDTLAACQSDTVTLVAAEGYPHYVWSTGATSPSIDCRYGNSFWIRDFYYQGIDENGCVSPPAMTYVDFDQTPWTPNFNLDDQIDLCEGQTYPLSPTNLNSTFDVEWSTGAIQDVIYVSEAMEVSASFIAANGGCNGPQSDTIVFTTNGVPVADPPIIDYSIPSPLCSTEELTLTAQGNFEEYIWKSGFFTNWNVAVGPSVTINKNDFANYGPYLFLTAIDENGCPVLVDSIHYEFLVYPTAISIGQQIDSDTICVNDQEIGQLDLFKWKLNGIPFIETMDYCILAEYPGIYEVVGYKEHCTTYPRRVTVARNFQPEVSVSYQSGSNDLIIDQSLDPSHQYLMQVHGLLGQEIIVSAMDPFAERQHHSLPELNTGIYVVTITDVTNENERILSKKIAVVD